MYTQSDVKKYYDTYTRKYMDIYGDVIQAFRPKRTKTLLNYLIKSIGIKYHHRLIDAGCGVCGPAIFFAKEKKCFIDAITISDQQVDIAQKKIHDANISKYVQVRDGDYHLLSSYYTPLSYDGVIFLESLGHATNPTLVLQEAYSCLQNGGFIYIKDFFIKKVNNPSHQAKIDKVIQNMNNGYSYNTLNLTDTIDALRAMDMEILYIKKFDFADDTTIRAKFETALNMDIFEGLPEFYPAEWLEIKCIKV